MKNEQIDRLCNRETKEPLQIPLAEATIIIMSILLLITTIAFAHTKGLMLSFDGGELIYTSEMNGSSADADAALFTGLFLIIPLCPVFLFCRKSLINIIWLSFFTGLSILFFLAICSWDQVDIAGTIWVGKNVPVAIWVILLFGMVPTYVGIKLVEIVRRGPMVNTKSKLRHQFLIITCLYGLFLFQIGHEIQTAWNYLLSDMDAPNWWGYSSMTFMWFIAHIVLSFVVSFAFWVKYDSDQHMKLSFWLLIPLCVIPILQWESGGSWSFANTMVEGSETLGRFLFWKHLYEFGVYIISMLLTGVVSIELLCRDVS